MRLLVRYRTNRGPSVGYGSPRDRTAWPRLSQYRWFVAGAIGMVLIASRTIGDEIALQFRRVRDDALMDSSCAPRSFLVAVSRSRPSSDPSAFISACGLALLPPPSGRGCQDQFTKVRQLAQRPANAAAARPGMTEHAPAQSMFLELLRSHGHAGEPGTLSSDLEPEAAGVQGDVVVADEPEKAPCPPMPRMRGAFSPSSPAPRAPTRISERLEP